MLTETQINSLKNESSPGNKVITSLFYALGDESRLKALKIFLKYPEKDICVSEVAAILNVSVPAASRQLKILERSDLIGRERIGQMICYKINKANPLVKAVITIVKSHILKVG